MTLSTLFEWTLPLWDSRSFPIAPILNTPGSNSIQRKIYWYCLTVSLLSHGTRFVDKRPRRLLSGSSSSVSFSLLSLNGGTPHPEARSNPLVVSCLGKYMKVPTESLACSIWEETLVVQLFDGLAKFYFVNWRNGIVFAVSFLDF